MFKLLIIFESLILANYLTGAQILRAQCSHSKSMAINVTQMSGVWWEVARSPAKINLACVKVKFTELESDNIVEIATTYSISNIYLWKNQTVYANISMDAISSVNGYNISYTNGITNENTVYKLLSADYNNYALICGYTNVNNSETSFGIILTRNRNPNITQLLQLEDAASLLYSDFEFGTMPLVTQSSICYTGAAATTYYRLSTIIAIVYIAIVYI